MIEYVPPVQQEIKPGESIKLEESGNSKIGDERDKNREIMYYRIAAYIMLANPKYALNHEIKKDIDG